MAQPRAKRWVCSFEWVRGRPHRHSLVGTRQSPCPPTPASPLEPGTPMAPMVLWEGLVLIAQPRTERCVCSSERVQGRPNRHSLVGTRQSPCPPTPASPLEPGTPMAPMVLWEGLVLIAQPRTERCVCSSERVQGRPNRHLLQTCSRQEKALMILLHAVWPCSRVPADPGL